MFSSTQLVSESSPRNLYLDFCSTFHLICQQQNGWKKSIVKCYKLRAVIEGVQKRQHTRDWKCFTSIEKALQPSHYKNGTKTFHNLPFHLPLEAFSHEHTQKMLACFWMWNPGRFLLIIWCAYYVSGANKSSALNKWNHVFVVGAIHQMLKSESGFSMIFSSLKSFNVLFAVVCWRVPCSLFKMHHVEDPRIHSSGCIW